MTHTCGRCGESFTYKHHLKQHYTRQTLCEAKVSMKTYETLLRESFPAKKERIYPCGYCDKAYTQQPNRSRHHATCVAKQEALRKAREAASQASEILEIVSTSVQASTSQLQEIQDIASTSTASSSSNAQQVDLLEEIRLLKEEVAEMKRGIGMHSSTNNITINNNIQVNNFGGGETYDHISAEFVKTCLLNNLSGAKNLIEKIHFSEEAPMNNNVRIKSRKNELIEVRKDGKWVAKDKNETLEKMIKMGLRILDTKFIEDCQNIDYETAHADETNLLDSIRAFLLKIRCSEDNVFFELRKRIYALIIEYNDRQVV